MFFKKSPPPTAATRTGTPFHGTSVATPPSSHPSASDGRHGDAVTLRLVTDESAEVSEQSAALQQASNDLGLVLDTLGSILGTFARHTFDLPDRPAAESAAELSRWHKHATLGVPLNPESGASASGIHPRDWNGVVRTFSEHRRTEKRYVDAAVGDLRDALWACIQTVHNAVRMDVSTDQSVATQMQRARKAITGMEIASIKGEVLSALSSMEGALETRRVQQEAQYRSLATHLDKLRDQLEEARLESTTDPLTGVGNRKLFDVALARSTQYHTLGREPVTLLMIDIDGLKAINDGYGHPAGDAAIVGVARSLSKIFLRQSDSVCRFGGDEFAAILPNTDTKMAMTLARRLISVVSELPLPDGMTAPFGVSVGIAEIRLAEDGETWISRADQALYSAKQRGRSCAVLAEA